MPQNKTPRLAELRVGLLILLALAVLVLVIFAVSGDLKVPGFGQTATVRTEMASVDGLRKGAEVRLSGKKIGSVKEIRFSNQIPGSKDANNMEIIMEIDGKLDGRSAIERIRTDSVATLKTAGVLGDNVIDISPGTQTGNPINNGDRINSQAQKSVGDILNATNAAINNFLSVSDDIKAITGQLRKGDGTAGKFLNDETLYLSLDRTVRQAETLLSSIREGDGTFSRLINDPVLYDQVTNTVTQLRGISDQINTQLEGKGKGTIGKLIKDDEIYNKANTLIAKANDISAKLDSVMLRIERGEGNLGKLIKDEQLYADARVTIEKLKGIADRLEKGEGTAGLLLKDEKLYNNVNTLSTEVTKLIYDFRQNPKKYLSVKVTIF
ncbi:MAG TPA: MlaD family protein [Blastocatellia bacterium]|nr:MlaD family protein [Blastocatellia bacterium]HMV82921.1 MlaD family protein [Blastocatellia bacterium]HMX25312.1 MlaD family protein [Blastocatellia bacterium]HMY70454.1 MlaD family protein [Blastocatellia bacterium]HMZ17062.1 MlaD family protein [Blastocatellia bacterium]